MKDTTKSGEACFVLYRMQITRCISWMSSRKVRIITAQCYAITLSCCTK